ncbi:hypothetical protein D3C78_1455830 [compost metagenome]
MSDASRLMGRCLVVMALSVERQNLLIAGRSARTTCWPVRLPKEEIFSRSATLSSERRRSAASLILTFSTELPRDRMWLASLKKVSVCILC